MSRLVSDYLLDCAARGLSPKTLRVTYRYPLEKVLLPFCEREGIDDVAQLDQRALNRLSIQLQEGVGAARGKPLSKYSVNSYLNAINVFLGWAEREGAGGRARARTPRLPKRVMDVLTREEIAKLEDLARSDRDAVIVRVLSETGLRASELLGIRMRDLTQSGPRTMVKVLGKGSRERLVPVTPSTFRRMRRLGRHLEPEQHLFRTLKRDRTGLDRPLSYAGLEQMLYNLGDAADIGKPVRPHAFRHAAATFLLQQGMNPMLVAEMLGHTSLRMIHQHYGHLTSGDVYNALIKALRPDG